THHHVLSAPQRFCYLYPRQNLHHNRHCLLLICPVRWLKQTLSLIQALEREYFLVEYLVNIQTTQFQPESCLHTCPAVPMLSLKPPHVLSENNILLVQALSLFLETF